MSWSIAFSNAIFRAGDSLSSEWGAKKAKSDSPILLQNTLWLSILRENGEGESLFLNVGRGRLEKGRKEVEKAGVVCKSAKNYLFFAVSSFLHSWLGAEHTGSLQVLIVQRVYL